MAGWRDERVLAAEDALRAAVRTAEDILAQEDPPPPPATESAPGPATEPAHRSVLRDAW